MSSTEVLIFGAGAVGAFYGSRIAQAGANVSCVCRSNYSAVKSNGFKVNSPQYGSYEWTPTRTFANPDEAQKSNVKWDYIVVSTKALPDVSDDSKQLEGLVSEDTSIVLIQNGLGVEQPYMKRFPHAAILSAVTVVSAAQPKHGIIDHNRWTRINVGPFSPDHVSAQASGTATARTETFVELLNKGGVKDASAYSHAKLQMVRWHKIAINASMNPSSVLSGGSANSAMALDDELYIHLKGVMDEVLETAPKVLKTPLPSAFATSEALLKSTRKNTSGSKPSMWLDWEAGKRMEIEVILGNPIRLAREAGFEMPRLQSLYALLKMAQANRERSKRASKL
ncbi:hypothetical protein AAFC00_007174 [Neodothiora populina]|uniref:2-dehydropantoate 2-reductase n=1 Tax=Neodothiora populina TaxID=2781224 RepID=A0ABR3PHE2_9PEZI